MKILDRVFGCLLFLGGIGHGFGAYKAQSGNPAGLLWALSGSFAIFLLAAVNLLRVGREGDHALAWVSLAGCLAWIGFVLWFGRLVGNMLDFRVVTHLVVTIVLAIFSLRGILAQLSAKT